MANFGGKFADLRPDHTELIGLNSGIACRLFNKGNSLAVKELKSCAMSDMGVKAGQDSSIPSPKNQLRPYPPTGQPVQP